MDGANLSGSIQKGDSKSHGSSNRWTVSREFSFLGSSAWGGRAFWICCLKSELDVTWSAVFLFSAGVVPSGRVSSDIIFLASLMYSLSDNDSARIGMEATEQRVCKGRVNDLHRFFNLKISSDPSGIGGICQVKSDASMLGRADQQPGCLSCRHRIYL